MAKRFSLFRGALLALFLTSMSVDPGRAQEGKTIFGENQQETLKAMKEVAKSLGLKCQDCHLKEGGKLNYKADTEHKKVARQMKRSLVDSLAQKGAAQILLQDGPHKSSVSATYRAQGDSAGIYLVLSTDDKTYTKTVPLPEAGQPLACMTCHNGQLHFLAPETAPGH